MSFSRAAQEISVTVEDLGHGSLRYFERTKCQPCTEQVQRGLKCWHAGEWLQQPARGMMSCFES